MSWGHFSNKLKISTVLKMVLEIYANVLASNAWTYFVALPSLQPNDQTENIGDVIFFTLPKTVPDKKSIGNGWVAFHTPSQ